MSEYGHEITTIREVFLYANRFREAVFVIHIANSVITSAYFDTIAKDISLLYRAGIHIIIVPGAREDIDKVLAEQQIETRYAQGRRITSERAITFVEMVTFNLSSKIMTHLARYHLQSVIGNWVEARTWGVHGGVDFLEAGRVESVHVDHLRQSIAYGAIPIVPCIGWNRSGYPYNVNSHELATVISIYMKVSKLLFLTSSEEMHSLRHIVPPPYQGKNNVQITVSELEKVQKYKEQPLLKETHQAVRGGIPRAHILDGEMDGSILLEVFSSSGVGVMVYIDEYECIRTARKEDVPLLMQLFRPLEERGILIHRSEEEILSQIEQFCVYETDGAVEGTAGLQVYEEEVGELMGLAVDHLHSNQGTGKRLVEYIIQQAKKKKLKKLYVCTTRTIDLFLSMGFAPGSPNELPVMRQQRHKDSGRNSRILCMRL